MGDNSAAQAEVVQEGEVELAPQAEQHRVSARAARARE